MEINKSRIQHQETYHSLASSPFWKDASYFYLTMKHLMSIDPQSVIPFRNYLKINLKSSNLQLTYQFFRDVNQYLMNFQENMLAYFEKPLVVQ
jgi:hypothetical protein